MPTAASSTEGTSVRPTVPVDGRVTQARRAVVDVGHLLRFRVGTLRRPRLASLGVLGFLVVTAAVAVVPAYVPGAGGGGRAFDVLLVLPTALAGFVVLAVVAAAASGGGRELLARDPATIHPVSTTTDHLGALLLAPLNIAWLLQAWALLGSTAYAIGSAHLLRAQLLVVLWLGLGTALAQVLAWTLEGVRRVRHGISVVRVLTVACVAVALGLQLTGRLASTFDRVPTRWFVVAMLDGWTGRYVAALAVVLVGLVACVALGAVPARIAARRVPRDELRVETGRHPARPMPGSVLGALVRTDRGSVWRAVSMRRGLAVLALGPALVALLGDLDWSSMTILPGLVASGGALLYGVNAWCLDGRGALWRESLPVPPTAVFDARAYVLAEFLLAASVLTVAVAALRAGPPTASELAALVATLAVVTCQVVGGAMRWSSRRPYAVDLRSSRATPAPPAMMVAYSGRLAVSTTVTGLFFSLLSRTDEPAVALLVAVPMLAWSTARLLRARREWAEPTHRARVVSAVAAA